MVGWDFAKTYPPCRFRFRLLKAGVCLCFVSSRLAISLITNPFLCSSHTSSCESSSSSGSRICSTSSNISICVCQIKLCSYGCKTLPSSILSPSVGNSL